MAAHWLSDPQTPAWARRHSAKGWAPLLAAPAAHNWVSADINPNAMEDLTCPVTNLKVCDLETVQKVSEAV